MFANESTSLVASQPQKSVVSHRGRLAYSTSHASSAQKKRAAFAIVGGKPRKVEFLTPSIPRTANMPATALPSIEAQINDIEVDCRVRMTKIRQVARMKDVLQLNDVRLEGQLRTRAPEIRGINQLQLAAETRMREILDGHMVELRAQRDMQKLEQARSHFLNREWSCLKGVFPLLHREAEVESDKVLARLERESEVRRRRSHK